MPAYKRIFVTAALAAFMAPTLPLIAQDAADATDAAAPAKPEPKVEVLDRGGDDRKTLRYAPETGTPFGLKMSMQLTMSQFVNGQLMGEQEMPTTNFSARMTADKVEGDLIHYTMSFDKVEVDGDDFMAQQMNAAFGGMEGLKGKGVITTRGFNKSLEFEGLDGMAPQLSGQINTMKSSIGDMSALLPEEAIGEGAKWRVISTIEQGGIVMQQTSTYTLESLKDGIVELGVSLSQTAEPQKIENDQVPAGMDVRLESFDGEASGRTTINLGWMAPVKGNVRSSVNADMSITSPQGEMRQGTQMSTVMTVTGERGQKADGDDGDSDRE